MIITLYGDNTYELYAARDQLANEAYKKYGEHGVVLLDGTILTLETLHEQLFAPNLFAPQKLIILRSASQQKETANSLVQLFAKIPDDITLVIIEQNLDKRTAFYKQLKKQTDFREFPTRDVGYLRKWLTNEVRTRGGTINSSAAAKLVEAVGADQWQLSQELDKLLAFSEEVTAETIAQLVVPNLETNVFTLIDVIFAKNAQQTQQLLHDLQIHHDPYEFFGLLVWQVHALAQISAAGGESSASIAKQTGLKPFVIQKTEAILRKIGQDGVQILVQEVANLDMKLKSSGMPPWLVIDQSIGKIMHKL